MAAIYSTATDPSLYITGGSGPSFRISGEYTWDSGTDYLMPTNSSGLYTTNSTNSTVTATLNYTSVSLDQIYRTMQTTSATTDYRATGTAFSDYMTVPATPSAYDDDSHAYESALRYLDYFISDDGRYTLGKKATYRSQLRSNLIVYTKHRGSLVKDPTESEQVALETLREVISEQEFRKYLRYGFVLVKGKSGDTYQIFRNREHTRVWRGGKVVEEICVRIKNREVPPTDNVIAFKTIIECSEEEFKKLGNVYKMAA